MANRRMFSKRVTYSARFLKMPPSTQALYFHLGMHADDDGIVEAFPILRAIGSTEDDLRILVAKGYVKVLNEDMVTYITDWEENNKIRKDRKIDSVYKGLLLEMLPETGISAQKSQPNDNQLSTNCQPTANHMTAQVRLGQDSIGQDRTDYLSNTNVLDCPPEDGRFAEIITAWNGLSVFGIAQIKRIIGGSQRMTMLKSRISQYGTSEVIAAIDRIKRSDFLQGKNNRGWIITFDWFIKPSNFAKVYEGNYDNSNHMQQQSDQTGADAYFAMAMEGRSE